MSAENQPKKQGFFKREFPAIIWGWHAAGEVTGFAATLVSIPIGIIGIPLAVNKNRELKAQGSEGIGILPLTQAIWENRRQVGETLNAIGIVGMGLNFCARTAPAHPSPAAVSPTPIIYNTEIPYRPTFTAIPSINQESTPTAAPLPSAGCITIGSEINTAGKAWKQLGSPGQVIFENLAGPDATGKAQTLTAPGGLPSIVHKGDKLCP